MELAMDLRIVWDKNRLREIDEAKAEIMKYKRSGYEILLADGKPMEKWSPFLEEVVIRAKKLGKHVMKILSEKGDERLVWDKEDGSEAKQAKLKFVELIKNGYSAYSVGVDGKKNRKIEEFDVDMEEILMIPATVKG